MKKLFIAIAFALLWGTQCSAQVVQDAQGNFITTPKAKAVNTGKTFTDSKGKVYPVYRSARGKYYVIRTSRKTGKQYKQYLKVEGSK